jgi:hypothetical protein
MASKAERELKIAQEIARKENLAAAKAQQTAAQAKLATYGSPQDIAFTKAVTPKFSAMSEIAKRVAAKAATKPDVLASQGLTLDQLQAKTTAVQQGAADYTTKVAGITQAEQDLITAQGLVGQYSTPIEIPEEDKPKLSDEITDAFALLKDVFTDYGLEELVPVIEGYMKQGVGPKQAAILLKQEPVYKTRFAGNEKRRTSGLNVLSEAEYLALEDAYSQTLKAYGQQTYFGTDRKARQAAMSNLIGGDISATEFKDRIDLAVTRVANADPLIKTQLKGYYNIEDTDLVGYFLNPTQNLPKLEEKVKAAEIGSAAAAQNLVTSMATAEDLAKFGVDLATARKGYATIADILPTTTKLGQIYKEEGITYGQTEAESETFKGLASAQRKRLQLAQREIGTFSGQSGTNRISLSNKAAGQI